MDTVAQAGRPKTITGEHGPVGCRPACELVPAASGMPPPIAFTDCGPEPAQPSVLKGLAWLGRAPSAAQCESHPADQPRAALIHQPCRLPDAHHPGAAVSRRARRAGHRKVHPRCVAGRSRLHSTAQHSAAAGGVSRWAGALPLSALPWGLCRAASASPPCSGLISPHAARPPPPSLRACLQPAALSRASSSSERTQTTWRCTNEPAKRQQQPGADA